MLSVVCSFFCLSWMLTIADSHILKTNSSSESDGNVIHCYCNLPSCITTSYMCRSDANENGCFKKFDLANLRYYYGCLESTIKQTLCPDIAEATTYPSSADSDEYFYKCCYSDMCNSESLDRQSNTIQLTNIHINESDEEKINEILSLKYTNRILPSYYYSNSEIWFRAVLITVPICGLMILLILIFVAIRLLKSDVPDDGKSSLKLLNQNHETSTNNKTFSISPVRDTRSFHSRFVPRCNIFHRNFLFVFRPQDKHQKTNPAKYFFISKEKETNNFNFNVPKVQEKCARQNLNILKLPFKSNELKLKSNKNVNVNVSNNCYGIVNPVTLDSKFNNIKKT